MYDKMFCAVQKTHMYTRTHTHTHATRSHLVGEDFSVLPEALLQLQLLRHLCELFCDKLGDCTHTQKIHTQR